MTLSRGGSAAFSGRNPLRKSLYLSLRLETGLKVTPASPSSKKCLMSTTISIVWEVHAAHWPKEALCLYYKE